MTPQELLRRYPEHLREIAESLRDLVRSTIPNVTEKAYTGWKLIGYRLTGEKKKPYFCCIVPQIPENDVLLGFEYGIAMKDPRGLMEGKGTQVRFVRIQRIDQHAQEDLAWLVEEGARAALEMIAPA